MLDSETNCEIIDNAISEEDFPPSLIPIGPCILEISFSAKPNSLSLSHLLIWVFCYQERQYKKIYSLKRTLEMDHQFLDHE